MNQKADPKASPLLKLAKFTKALYIEVIVGS